MTYRRDVSTHRDPDDADTTAAAVGAEPNIEHRGHIVHPDKSQGSENVTEDEHVGQTETNVDSMGNVESGRNENVTGAGAKASEDASAGDDANTAPSGTATHDEDTDDEDDEPPTLWPKGTQFGRADKICLALIVGVTVFGLIMMPARPIILTWAPLAIVALTGSRSGMVACGALAAVGAAGMPTPMAIAVPLVVGTISVVKFDPIYWWAGKLWGDWFIKAMAGQTERQQRRAARAEALARRYMVPAIGITYIPYVPLPVAIIHAVLGTAGVSLRKFIAVDLVFAAIAQIGYFTLGWFIGEPAVQLLEELAKYSLWLALAVIVFIFVGSYRASMKAEKEKAQRRAERAAQTAGRSRPSGGATSLTSPGAGGAQTPDPQPGQDSDRPQQ